MKNLNEQSVYDNLCSYMDENGLTYKKNDENTEILFGMNGDDIPMTFTVKVDEDKEIIKVCSLLPVVFMEDKRVDGALVTCCANYKLSKGGFQYDLNDGTVMFLMTNAYMGSLLSKSIFEYIIGFAVSVVDNYNDKFFLVAKGKMSVEEFLKSE